MMPDGMHVTAGGGSMRNAGSSEIVASGTILLPNLGTQSVSSTCGESNQTLQPFLERAVKQHMQDNDSLTAHVDNVATVQGELARINEQSHRRERKNATGKAGAKMHASMQAARRAGGSANVTHAPAWHGSEGTNVQEQQDEDNECCDDQAKRATKMMLRNH